MVMSFLPLTIECVSVSTYGGLAGCPKATAHEAIFLVPFTRFATSRTSLRTL